MRVFKFGGASVRDAESVRNAIQIIKNEGKGPLLIVVSAMGKTTNAMERVLIEVLKNRENARAILKQVIDDHLEIVNELFEAESHIYNEIDMLSEQANEIIDTGNTGKPDYLYDQLVPFGELLSTKIFSEFLKHEGVNNQWFDARDIIKTDYQYKSANVDWKRTEIQVENTIAQFLKNSASPFAVTQGFIAGADALNPTTLGREGSDYSASIFAFALHAKNVTIWKDVPGVLNADPKHFKETTLLDHISYREAIELAYYGASVIHPKTIQPLQNKKIPLYVRAFKNFSEPGTLIDSSSNNDETVPSFIIRKDQRLVSISTRDFSFIVEDHLSDIFEEFARFRVKINMMQNSAINFSVSVDENSFQLNELIDELSKRYQILYNQGLELLTIRHFNDEIFKKLTSDRKILLEQKTRNTLRVLMR
jgi:aspartate kinase